MQALATAAAVTTLLRAISAPAIGTHWVEQGGYYAGIVRGQNGQPDYHLIVAADPAGHFEGIAFGPYPHKMEGADSFADGLANTQALAAQGEPHPAAVATRALTAAGFPDWYLPAIGELRLLHTNVPELFQKDELYWSSTQYSPTGAWAQDFEDGDSSFYSKYGELRAVAVRRLAI